MFNILIKIRILVTNYIFSDMKCLNTLLDINNVHVFMNGGLYAKNKIKKI